jgi:hypothetical protein
LSHDDDDRPARGGKFIALMSTMGCGAEKAAAASPLAAANEPDFPSFDFPPVRAPVPLLLPVLLPSLLPPELVILPAAGPDDVPPLLLLLLRVWAEVLLLLMLPPSPRALLAPAPRPPAP